MKQILTAIFVAILTSLYFFPFNTVWLPSVNTKMALAALSLIFIIVNGAKRRNAEVSSSMILLSVCALAVTIMGLVAVIYNNTHDYAYAGYFVSMWVWLGGAYVIVKTMDWAYGRVTFRMVGNFLIVICVAQCLLAQIINNVSFVAELVDGFMVSTGFMGKVENRLYGIGCALDVAGMKFSAVLVITAYLWVFPNSEEHSNRERYLYAFVFFVIAIFGPMIARTTTIGILLSIVLWILLYLFHHQERGNLIAALKTLLGVLVVLFPILIFFYDTDPIFRENIRFAFEGFFSLAEKGKWIVRSNQMMESMIVWPDNLKTWVIGDGYFENPMKDFYYNGPAYAYYKGVDTGYCRFIFYFGILGLLMLSSVFVAAAIICSKNHPRFAIVFWLILLLNFICWVKVSSDIFPVFAIFLWLTASPVGETEVPLVHKSNEN